MRQFHMSEYLLLGQWRTYRRSSRNNFHKNSFLTSMSLLVLFYEKNGKHVLLPTHVSTSDFLMIFL